MQLRFGPSRRVMLAVAGVMLLSACGDSGATGVSTPQPLGTIALTLTPGSVTVPAGASGSVGLSITRGGGFAGAVTLTASGQPAGVTITFGSSPVAAGAVSTSVTIVVPAGMIPGTYPVTIRGAGAGATTQETTLTLRAN